MGGSSQPAQVTQTSRVELSPEQQKIANLAFPMAEQYASTPLQQYQGPSIAPFNPNEVAAQQQYLAGVAPTGAGLAGQSAQAQSMTLNPEFMLNVGNNPYLQAAATAMAGGVNRNLLDTQLPALRSGATQAGGMYSGASSKSGIAEGKAVSGTNQAISDSVTKMMFDAYNRGLSGMEQAIGRTGAVQGQQTFAPDITSAVGSQQRAMDQALLDQQIKQFYTGQQLPLLQAQDLMGLISGMPGATAIGQTTGAMPAANPLMQGGGILASLLGLLL